MSTRPYKEVVAVIPAPMKGINMLMAVDKLQPDEAVDIRGFEFQEYGVLGMPWGNLALGQIGEEDTKVISAHVFQREGQTPQLLWQLDDGTLRVSDNFLDCDGGDIDTDEIATGLSETARLSFVTFLDVVYMSNGVDDYMMWDGDDITQLSDVPKMKYLAVWKDCVWGAATTEDPHRVFRSDPGDGSTWDPLEFVDIEKGRGKGITSIAAEPTELVVFKYLGTFSIYDPIEYTNRIVDPDKGSVSHWGTINHNGRLYFISHIGVCLYVGDGPSQVVSEKIAPVFDDLRVKNDDDDYLRDWDGEFVTPACSFEDRIDFRIPLFFGDGFDTYSNFQLYPDYPDRPWLRSGPGGEYAIVAKEPGFPAIQFEFIGEVLYRRYSDKTNPSPNGRWWTSWCDFDQPIDEKYLHTAVVLARGAYKLAIFKDFDGANSATPGSDDGVVGSNLGNVQDVLMTDSTVYTDAYGKAFQLNLQVVSLGVAPVEGKAARFNGNDDAAYAAIDLESDQTEVWVEFRMWSDDDAQAAQGQSIWTWPDGEYPNPLTTTLQTGIGPDPGPGAGGPILVEYHYVDGGAFQLYHDGIAIFDDDPSGFTGLVRTVALIIPNPAYVPAGIIHIADVKVGTTRHGTDLFEDDFSDETLDAWTDVSGDVTVVDEPTGETVELEQRVSSGQNAPIPVSRYAGAFSRIVLRARILGEGYR